MTLLLILLVWVVFSAVLVLGAGRMVAIRERQRPTGHSADVVGAAPRRPRAVRHSRTRRDLKAERFNSPHRAA